MGAVLCECEKTEDVATGTLPKKQVPLSVLRSSEGINVDSSDYNSGLSSPERTRKGKKRSKSYLEYKKSKSETEKKLE